MSAQQPLAPGEAELTQEGAAIPEENEVTEEIPEDIPEETPEENAARKRRIRRLACLLALFLALDALAAGVLLAIVRRDRESARLTQDAQAQKIGITQEMTEEERQESLAIALGEAHNCVSLRSEPIVRDGVVEIYLANHEDSPCAVSMQLVRFDTGDVLLETGVIEPGWYLESAALDMQLEPGEYHCLARCLFYTMDDNAYLGRTARQVLLCVR